jgi:thioredoxin reductase
VPDKIAIIGGGAAGFFAAIASARANPSNEISIYERGS